MSDERIRKSAGESRRTRAVVDRTATQNRELSEDERVEMFRQQFHQSALPDLPKIPGWHVCWLTTSNSRDPIHNRMRLGYVPVKPEDLPGYDYVTLKTGEYEGMIGVNEMLAFKLPMSLYEKFMQHAHHTAPMNEEEKLTDTTEYMEQEARASKSRIETYDGMDDIGQSREGSFDLE